ncbi:Ig-like protein group 2 [Bacteroides heparinolyticus]|uniref:Ig-like protein group 2 n=1 Tax=Prevotella heparinolytica TaxID=28113 RepID=A0A4R2LFQ6_9BACE|nr:Ig-like domain-containing protein [Bacteroides heparinolyticus]TCO87683.1 Ig-like protein group 2 [Bacteroides heparinolyticus]
MKKTLFVIMAVVLPLVFSACSSGGNEIDTSDVITLNKSEVELLHNETFQLKISGNNNRLVFEVENENIAKVDENGLITGNVKGETNVVVKAGKSSAKCSVKVNTSVNDIREPYFLFGKGYDEVNRIVTADKEPIVVGSLERKPGRSISFRTSENYVQYIYAYLFDDTEKLDKISIMIDCRRYKTEYYRLLDFALERYFIVSQPGTMKYNLMSIDKKMIVSTDLKTEVFSLMFRENN